MDIERGKDIVTAGHKALLESQGFIVVWATIDPKAGDPGCALLL
jgi:hypothetical protein